MSKFYIIISLLILTSCILILVIFSFIRNINNISAILIDIISGNLNRRVNLGTAKKSLKELSINLNTLIDQSETNNVKVYNLETSQKRVISNISHDMRTPLTSLLGYIEMLKKDLTLSQEEKANYLEIISLKGKSLYTLIQNFFEMAKLESDDTLIECSKLDIINVIQEVMLSFYSDFQQNNLKPVLELPSQPIYVLADMSSLQRILQNFISNTLRYGKDGGIIGVSLREEKYRVWVDVWDCGKGIPEKDMKYLFERLYTSEPSRNIKFGGSGLGLSISKKMVEKMKGEIFASSIPGEKTTFSFYLQRYKL